MRKLRSILDYNSRKSAKWADKARKRLLNGMTI